MSIVSSDAMSLEGIAAVRSAVTTSCTPHPTSLPARLRSHGCNSATTRTPPDLVATLAKATAHIGASLRQNFEHVSSGFQLTTSTCIFYACVLSRAMQQNTMKTTHPFVSIYIGRYQDAENVFFCFHWRCRHSVFFVDACLEHTLFGG